MADEQAQQSEPTTPKAPATHVAPSPHVGEQGMTTDRMMRDVLIALVPVLIIAGWNAHQFLVYQLAICIAGCVAAEAIWTALRRQPLRIGDCSAVVTGAILALSMPWSSPWYVSLIGAVAAIVIGKMIFGGLGQNMFNPAMVGRAFVMICFAGKMSASAYIDKIGTGIDALSQATPLSAFRESGNVPELMTEFLGTHNGSLGETSALACLIGGIFLCVRRTAAWQIPLGVILSVTVIGSLLQIGGAEFGVLHHLFSGALLFGAFYIATDPTSSPLTPLGRLIFGLAVGAMIMLLRTLSSYPEGVMFAVLIVNAFVPLINRWTIPTPVGGPVPERR